MHSCCASAGLRCWEPLQGCVLLRGKPGQMGPSPLLVAQPLHQFGGAGAAAWVPRQCFLGHGAATVPILTFPAIQQELLSWAELWGSLSQGLPSVLTLWPAGSLHFGSTGLLSPPSLRNNSRASVGGQAQAGHPATPRVQEDTAPSPRL